MVITWHGEGALKIATKEVTVAINPHTEKEMKMPKFAANIALLGGSFATDKGLRENPFVIDNPGEYEVQDVFVYGIAAQGIDEAITVFVLDVEGVKVGVLSGIAQDQLKSEQLEFLENVDVLCVPVGGTDTLNAKQAIKMINQTEPRIIIPIDYKVAGTSAKDGVESFLTEYGAENKHEKVDKLKLTKKDLPQDDTKVIVINPS